MIIKITFPFKDSPNTIELKEIVIETDDNDLITQLKSTNNPIEIGIILSENERKYKKIDSEKKEDLHIEIAEVLTSPALRKKFNF
ncbi:conserved hypothetical protein [Lebetimonas natsushimae]|uniref:Uncharacterized protein n=1 Tax=Lebetimonas natsushimae TaxID=1936991 RepID=A0A292YEJ8_9BACT|nr:hypothetical protein [Lebetimonas natsushimae]GAX87524.1 conserved hypothetical protein [Lebetimonas natsushimae]